MRGSFGDKGQLRPLTAFIYHRPWKRLRVDWGSPPQIVRIEKISQRAFLFRYCMPALTFKLRPLTRDRRGRLFRDARFACNRTSSFVQLNPRLSQQGLIELAGWTPRLVFVRSGLRTMCEYRQAHRRDILEKGVRHE